MAILKTFFGFERRSLKIDIALLSKKVNIWA